MNTSKSLEFEDRLIEFSISIINFTKQYKNELPFSVVDQIIRSSTSVGANYAEAQNASSRADFKNKIYIAKKEAAQTRYWLKIIERLIGGKNLRPYLQEVQEIILIFQKIATTLREKPAK